LQVLPNYLQKIYYNSNTEPPVWSGLKKWITGVGLFKDGINDGIFIF
jgi:hypothetical protein